MFRPSSRYRGCILRSFEKGGMMLLGHLRPVSGPPGALLIQLPEELVVVGIGSRIAGGVRVDVA